MKKYTSPRFHPQKPASARDAVRSAEPAGLDDSAASTRRRRRLCLGAGFVLAFYVLAYLVSLGARPLVRPDEFRYAEIPREMIASGDWISPRLLGMPYFEKPALGYQLIAAAFTLFGETRFALRLPSALAPGLAAAMLFALFALRTKRDWLPALAALLYLSCALVFGTGVFAVLDAPFSAALAICLMAFFLAFSAESPASRAGWLLLAGISAGVAFLIKGFLAFLLPALVVLPYLFFQPGQRIHFRRLWIPAAAALLVALPWSLAILRRNPEFWKYFILVEHFQRFTAQTADSKPEPVWYFIPVLLGGLLPTGLLALVTRGVWNRDFLRRPLVRYLLVAAALPFLFFSASSCKLGTYILPCFPFLAGLLALALDDALLSRPVRTARALARLLRIWGIVLLAAVPVAYIAWMRMAGSWPSPLPPLLVLLTAALWGAALVITAGARPLPLRFVSLFLGFALVAAAFLRAVPTVAMARKMPEDHIARCLDALHVRPGDTIFVDRQAMQAVAWTLKRSDLHLVGDTGELTYPLTRYPALEARHHETLDAIPAAAHPPGSRIYVSTSRPENFQTPARATILARASRPGATAIRF